MSLRRSSPTSLRQKMGRSDSRDNNRRRWLILGACKVNRTANYANDRLSWNFKCMQTELYSWRSLDTVRYSFMTRPFCSRSRTKLTLPSVSASVMMSSKRPTKERNEACTMFHTWGESEFTWAPIDALIEDLLFCHIAPVPSNGQLQLVKQLVSIFGPLTYIKVKQYMNIFESMKVKIIPQFKIRVMKHLSKEQKEWPNPSLHSCSCQIL